MRTVGIIAEYNPFHSGHAYQLAQAKAAARADYALVVMSGDFVQRGEPAMFPKRLRAKWALEGGADLVLALPAVYSLTSAAGFAEGAVGLLAATGLVDALSFGSECGDLRTLERALDAEGTPGQEAAVQAALRAGQSYPAARQAALSAADISLGPNDILGLSYLRALRKLGVSMEPLPIPRQGAGHDAGGLSAPFASATALRQAILHRDWHGVSPHLSLAAILQIQTLAQQGGLRLFPALSQAVLYALRRLSKEELCALGEISEGLENPLYKACRQAATIEELLALVKTRRYPMARLKRACLCALLGITGHDLALAAEGAYLRVLGARREALPLLGSLNKAAHIPVVSRFADTAAFQGPRRRLFELDRFAAETACLAAQQPQPAPFDFGEPLVLVD